MVNRPSNTAFSYRPADMKHQAGGGREGQEAPLAVHFQYACGGHFGPYASNLKARARCIVLGLHCDTAGSALDYQQGATAEAAQQRCATATNAMPGSAMRPTRARPQSTPQAQEPRSPRAPGPQTPWPAKHTHLHADATSQPEKPHPSLHAVSTDTMAT